MNEELNGIDSSPENASPSGDLSNEVDSTQMFEEQQKTNELLEQLNEIIKEQQLTEEELQVQIMNAEQDALTVQGQSEILQSIFEEMQTMNSQIIVLQERIPKEELIVEGYYFVGLSVVITFAVYMFWNQLSKW